MPASLLNVFADEIGAIGRRKGLKVLSYNPSVEMAEPPRRK